jgi:hypothetical protein
VAKVWVLDTETKGTGANVVPLERVQRKRGAEAVPGFALPALRPPSPSQPDHRTPREFKVVEILTRGVLGEGLDARATVDVLKDVRSIVDVTVYVWEPEAERWRMLTYSETRMLWEYRGRVDHARPAEVTTAGE